MIVYIGHGECCENYPVEEMEVSSNNILHIISEVSKKYCDRHIDIYENRSPKWPDYGDDKKILAQRQYGKNDGKWRIPAKGYRYLDCKHEKIFLPTTKEQLI